MSQFGTLYRLLPSQIGKISHAIIVGLPIRFLYRPLFFCLIPTVFRHTSEVVPLFVPLSPSRDFTLVAELVVDLNRLLSPEYWIKLMALVDKTLKSPPVGSLT